MKTNIKSLAFISLFTTIICISSVITIPLPFTAIPITLSFFGISLAALSLPLKDALLSVFAFILIGFIGIPVFSSFRGGAWVLLSPTGGYIIGYIPFVFVSALVLKVIKDSQNKILNFIKSFFAAFFGMLACYVFGLLQFSIITKTPLLQSMALTVLPFIVPDIFKILAAVIISPRLKRIIIASLK